MLVRFGTLEVKQLPRLLPQEPQMARAVYTAAVRTLHCISLTSLIMIPQIRIYVDMKTVLHWRSESIQLQEFS